MNLPQEIQDWLDSAYTLASDKESTDGIEAPLLLLVKEAVLDILWVNDPKYSKENWILDVNELPENIKKVMNSTHINEILWSLNNENQKEVRKLFESHPKSRILNIIWFSKREKNWIHFFEESLENDVKNWLPPNWRACYNLWFCYFELWDYEKTRKYLLLALENNPFKDIIWSINSNLWFCYFKFWDYEKSINYYKLALENNPLKNQIRYIHVHLWLSYSHLWDYEEARKYLLLAYSNIYIDKDVRLGVLQDLYKNEEINWV